MDREPVTYKLKHPVKVGSEEIFELTFQRPKAKHLRLLPSDPKVGDLLNFAAKLAGKTPVEIDELEMEDTMEVLEIVGNFMPTGQKTGK